MAMQGETALQLHSTTINIVNRHLQELASHNDTLRQSFAKELKN